MAVYLCVCVFPLPSCACVIYTFTTHSVVVYIAGGATYEEATKVAELNASGGIQVVLGGSYLVPLDLLELPDRRPKASGRTQQK